MIAALVSFGAAADIAVTDVNVTDTHAGGLPEMDLLDIYEALYGATGYTTSDELYEAVGVDPDDYNGPAVSHFFGDQGVALEARYALFNYDFGYYDPVLPGAVANQNLLFSVTGPYVDPPNPGGPTGAIVSPAVEPYGFYLDVDETGVELYSEYDRNSDGRVHMLLLATPNADEYLMAWEDRLDGDPQADWDYNDLVVVAKPIIPEPSSIILMGLGIAGLAVNRFRKMA